MPCWLSQIPQLRPEYTRPPIPVFTTLADIRWAQAQQILTKLVSIELDTLKSIWAVANTLTAVTSSAQLPPECRPLSLFGPAEPMSLCWLQSTANIRFYGIFDMKIIKTGFWQRSADDESSTPNNLLLWRHDHNDWQLVILILTSVLVSLRTSLFRLLLRLSSLWVLSVWV